jgi:RNA polymerase sigma factor (sigma-70 family)
MPPVPAELGEKLAAMTHAPQSDEDRPVADAGGTDDLLPTHRSLLHRLKNWEDQVSWQAFFDTYWRLIYRVAVRSGLSDSEAEEVVQVTVLSVAKAMKNFDYDPARGSFKGWLLQLTGWRIANQFARRKAAARTPETPAGNDGSSADQLVAAPEPEALSALEQLWDDEWKQNLMAAALQRVRGRVNPKHLQIFDLCVQQQKSVREVCRFLGVGAAKVYLARHRVGRLLQQEIARMKDRPI